MEGFRDRRKASSYREVFFVLVSINKETNRNFPFRSNRGVVLMFCPHVNQSRLERVDGMASRECKIVDNPHTGTKIENTGVAFVVVRSIDIG